MAKIRRKPAAQPAQDATPSLRAPRDRRRWFVVSYDIPDNKRRTKVMKLLEGYGRRAQFSVFECHVAPEEMFEEAFSGVSDQDGASSCPQLWDRFQ